MLVTDIKWETDGEIVSLPTEVEVDDNMSDDDIDEFGMYVNEVEGKVS
jgi:hypothetical protein